ncbi:hypothetical protein GWN42_03860 [candidate division KSB1 bacterium]|nr:hypothetical protein [candidate division KSB1 bacterium]
MSDLGPLLDYSGNLVMFRSRLHKSAQNKQSWKLVSRYQAAVMLFDPGSTVSLYNRFCLNPEYYMRTYRSEQDIMGEWIPNQPTFPDRWLMKMGQLKRNLGDTIIVTGQPRNRDFRTVEWIERIAR